MRFLIAMPCRRGEAARLDWAHLDLAAAEWRQPSHMTKNRDPHRLHLHPLALEILSGRHTALTKARGIDDHKRAARIVADDVPRSGLVFPAPVSGRVVDTFSDLRLALVKATGQSGDGVEADELTGWTWHDFRRSFASALGEAAIPESVADAILNHRQATTRGGVLGVYQRSSRWPEQMRAMQLWGQLLSDALGRNAPVAGPEQRDPKALYRKARAGLIKEFTGIDAPYETPDDAEVIVHTHQAGVRESADTLVAFLLQRLLDSGNEASPR